MKNWPDDHVPMRLSAAFRQQLREKFLIRSPKFINTNISDVRMQRGLVGRALELPAAKATRPYDGLMYGVQALLASRFSEVDSAYDPNASSSGVAMMVTIPGRRLPGSFRACREWVTRIFRCSHAAMPFRSRPTAIRRRSSLKDRFLPR